MSKVAPSAEDEQAPVLGVDRGASPAEAEVGADAAAETGGQQQPRPPSCCKRCKRCSYRLLNRRVRGLRLPAFLGLLGSLVLPEMDAVSDWLVTLEFYEGGDMGWFKASLTVLLVSGGVATVLLAVVFAEADAVCCRSLEDKGTCGSKPLLVLLAAPFGLSGLAPVVVAALTLHQGVQAGAQDKLMKVFKAVELVFEALPQSILQAYVAIAYGRLDPSDPEHFSRLLCFSICVSLLGAGATCFGFEASYRNDRGRQVVGGAGSRYGIATILLRACQTAMLVFWIALMACAQKGYAVVAVVASVVVYVGAGLEASAWREDGPIEPSDCLDRIQTFGGLGRGALPRAFLWNTLPLLIAGTIASTFWTVEHYDNNYANRSAPVGPPGSPQHFDCRERTSGIYPTLFFTAMSLALMPLSLGMDPQVGVRCLRGKSSREKWKEQYARDVLGVVGKVLVEKGLVAGGTGSEEAARAVAQAAYGCLGDVGPMRGGKRGLEDHTGDVSSASFSPDSQHIVTASWDKTARVWHAQTGACKQVLEGHTGRVNSASFSPDGQHIVTASDDFTARVWDAQTGACKQVLYTRSVNSASFSPDSQHIVTASDDFTARVWHAQTGACKQVLEGHTGFVMSASFSPDGQHIVTASWDRTARVWDAQTGACKQVLEGHTGDVSSASFSPDSQHIVTASYDMTARVWDAQTGACKQVLEGHTGSVMSASFSPDGQHIVTASDDFTARVWDAQTGACKQVLEGRTLCRVRSASFSPDGQRIVTVGDDRTALVHTAHADVQALVDALTVAGVEPPASVTEDIIGSLRAECERAVQRTKLDAVWRWAAPTMARDTLGELEVERIVEATGTEIGTDSDGVRSMLGAIASEEVRVSKQQLAEAKHGMALLADVLYEKLQLPLLEAEAGCLDFLCAC